MRILLDGCFQRRLKVSLASHGGQRLREGAWAGVKNGDRLAFAENAGLQVSLTIDFSDDRSENGIPAEPGRERIAVAFISSQSNRLSDFEPQVPEVPRVVVSLEPGQASR